MGGEDDDGEGFGGSRREALVENVEEVLLWTGGWLHDHAWISGGKAYAEGGTPTKSFVLDLIWPPRFGGPNARRDRDSYQRVKDAAAGAINDDMRAEVKAAMAWVVKAAAADLENDYLAACATLAENGFASARRFGYVCSILSSYRRHLGQVEEKAARQPDLNRTVARDFQYRAPTKRPLFPLSR